MDMRKCCKCDQEKELNEKNFIEHKPTGTYRYWCRPCCNDYEQARYHRVQAQSYSPKISRQAIDKFVQAYKEGKV